MESGKTRLFNKIPLAFFIHPDLFVKIIKRSEEINANVTTAPLLSGRLQSGEQQ